MPKARSSEGSLRAAPATIAYPRHDETEREHIRIDVSQEWQCRYWSRELGVTSDELKAAVQEAGPVLKDVREQLMK
jgi:hypothetical protein